MVERMFGLETEFALSVLGPRGARVDQGRALSCLMELAQHRLPHLPDRTVHGMFLQNGGRFYIDCGGHPEWSTPEIVNPWDACRYSLAGDRILAGLAEGLVAQGRLARQVILTRCNVCYDRERPTTWGSHESYGHRCDPSLLSSELIPHLISRVIYTGAGGFDNRSPGVEFMVSPRVAHLPNVVSDASTCNRGIFHSKDETLSSHGHHRLHLLCGEALCSQTALWLRVAVTSLVVAMIEAGLGPCRRISPCSPLEAMRRFATDVHCTVRVPCTDGQRRSAIEMQRHILQQIEAHVDHPILPPWTPQVCQLLQKVLEKLEQGPAAAATSLDWAIKRALYEEFARRRGIAWHLLSVWNQVLGELGCAMRRRRPDCDPPPISAELLGSGSPVAKEVARLTPLLCERGAGWDQLEAVLSLRQELFELDTRFAQLGPEGIFTALDQTGALEHAVPGVDNIEHAMANPPATGRARLRGECVRRLSSRGQECSCDWMGVWDDGQQRYLDLSQPFASEEHWQHTPEAIAPHAVRHAGLLSELLAMTRQSYDQGHYERAHQILGSIPPVDRLLGQESRRELLRLRSRVQVRRGYLDGAAPLGQLGIPEPLPLWLITEYVFLFRFRGLTASPEIYTWINGGRELLASLPPDQSNSGDGLREHEAYVFMLEGRLAEAADTLEGICGRWRQSDQDQRNFCRALAVLGEVYRRSGRPRESQRALDEAAERQTRHGFQGDLADFSLTHLAKLQTDRARARTILGDAKRIQAELLNRMGEARTLLLEARLSTDSDHASAIKERVLELKERVPALGQCGLLAKVLARWGAWTNGELAPDESGDVFWHV